MEHLLEVASPESSLPVLVLSTTFKISITLQHKIFKATEFPTVSFSVLPCKYVSFHQC